MTREQMMNMVIESYGLEARETIEFFKLYKEAVKAEGILDTFLTMFYLELIR